MSKLFANEKIAVACPKCGHKIQQTIRRLEQNPKLTCPSCQSIIDVDASELRKGLSEVDKAFDNLRRRLG